MRMDPTWGVVIVSVVGVAGTVVASLIQTKHTARLAREQRNHERDDQRHAAILSAYLAFLEALDSLDRVYESHDNTDPAEWIQLLMDRRFRLRTAESALAVAAPRHVTDSARLVVDSYFDHSGQPADTQQLKDDLAASVRVALGNI